ncbi:MAG: helix-turn-helix transcriptional regulator, partial [Rhizobiales bacterium]|nr:helix-turn-helix transcriptional regulator [Hyphomicrobiales bacterium]
MSKKGFAEAIGVSPNTVLRYETGAINPTNEKVEKIAQILGFPLKFFFGDDVDEPRRDNASFRGMASKTGKVMDAALASGALAFLLDDWIGTEFYRSEDNLLDL